MGDYAKAEPLYQQALQIRQNVLGPEHPDTATTLNNLADFIKPWVIMPRPNRSFSKYSKSGKRCSVRNTPTPPEASITWRFFMISMGDYAKAEPLFSKHSKSLKRCSVQNTLSLSPGSIIWYLFMRRWAIMPRPNPSFSKYSKSGKRCSVQNTPTLPPVSITWRLYHASGRLRQGRTALSASTPNL